MQRYTKKFEKFDSLINKPLDSNPQGAATLKIYLDTTLHPNLDIDTTFDIDIRHRHSTFLFCKYLLFPIKKVFFLHQKWRSVYLSHKIVDKFYNCEMQKQ